MPRLASLAAIARTAVRQPDHFASLLVRKARSFQRCQWVKQVPAGTAVPPPLVLKFLLTYRCNLRCAKCMLWGARGWCGQAEATDELDFGLLERTLAAAQAWSPSLIFSGGEPFLYRHIRELLALLRQGRWSATFCTNGTRLAGLEQHLDGNSLLSLLVSLDGPDVVNDRLRGGGVYAQVTAAIRRVKALARPPHVGVQLTLRNENVPHLIEFCAAMVALGVDFVLLNPPWSISDRQAADYTAQLDRDFGAAVRSASGYRIPGDLDPAVLARALGRVHARRWPIQIGSYLRGAAAIERHLTRPEEPSGDFCFKQWLRMDVLPSGQVTPCAQFPDVVVGDLRTQSLAEVWNGPAYARFRDRLRTRLLPVCSQCNALYLYDAGRAVL